MAEFYQKYFTTMMEQLQKNRLRVARLATAGAAAVLMGVTVYKYRQGMINTFVMPAVHVLPAETSHNLAVWAFKNQLMPMQDEPDDLKLRTQLFGHDISNPIGIAAGFDKHGEAILGLKNVGFGFVEIGSVTPEPQKGNAGPRVFRLSSDRAVINRYGFNSEGHEKVLERLRAVKEDKKNDVVVGVNLGRNRSTKGIVQDYVKGVEVFAPYADYLVINVSSPNTKGLRNLQSKDQLEYLLERVNLARERLPEPHRNVPILLKLSPDLDMADVKDITDVIKQPKYRVDGLIVANTTTTRDNLKDKRLAKETGGLSGAPLRKRSTQMIAYVYKLTNGKIPIIGVGGIESGKDAFEKIEAGASFVQFYTALVYEGPEVVTRIKNDLTILVEESGATSVKDIVGRNNRNYLPNASAPMFRRHDVTPKPVEADATKTIDDNDTNNEKYSGHNF